MRTLSAALFLSLICLATNSQADPPMHIPGTIITPAHGTVPAYTLHTVGTACACGQMPTPVYQPIYPTVNACSSCNSCGSLCSNWPEFYNRLYAEFYANNQWYVIAKQKENAARLARLRGLPEPEPVAPQK